MRVLMTWMVGDYEDVKAQHDFLTEKGWTHENQLQRYKIFELDATPDEILERAPAVLAAEVDVPTFSLDWVSIGLSAGDDERGQWDKELVFFSQSLDERFPPTG